jgi:hypothetical protein
MPPIWRHLAADERGVSVARSCKALSASRPRFCVSVCACLGGRAGCCQGAAAAMSVPHDVFLSV